MIDSGGHDWRWRIAIAGALLVSIAGRLLALWIAGDRVPLGDPANYEIIARNLCAGRGMVIDDPKIMADLRAYYPPGYPLLLAAVCLVLPLKAATFALLNTMIDAVAALVLAKLGARLGFAGAGILAALTYFAWPTQVLLAPLAYKEGLVALLVVAQCLVVLDADESWRKAVGFGLLTGIATLVQPALLLLAPLLGLAVRGRFPTWSSWVRAMAIAVAVTTLTLLPWWIRNWLVFHAFVPLTTAGPSGLWIGVASPAGWVQLPREFLLGGELESARLFAAESWRLIVADPVGYLLGSLGKIPAAFAQSDHPIGLLFTMQPHRHGALLMRIGWLPTLATLAMLIAAAWGILRNGPPQLNRMILAALAYIPLVAMWFEFSARHRYYLTPLLLLAAATLAARDPDSKRPESKGEGS